MGILEKPAEWYKERGKPPVFLSFCKYVGRWDRLIGNESSCSWVGGFSACTGACMGACMGALMRGQVGGGWLCGWSARWLIEWMSGWVGAELGGGWLLGWLLV